MADLLVGLLIGWVIEPVEFVDATPAYLRADLQEDYLRMAIDSYSVNPDPDLAVQRWKGLGEDAQQAFANVQANPKGVDPAVIQAYGRGGYNCAFQSTRRLLKIQRLQLMQNLLITGAIVLVLGRIGCGGILSLSFVGQARQR